MISRNEVSVGLCSGYYIDLAVENTFHFRVIPIVTGRKTLRIDVVSQIDDSCILVELKRLLEEFQLGMNIVLLFTGVADEDNPVSQ